METSRSRQVEEEPHSALHKCIFHLSLSLPHQRRCRRGHLAARVAGQPVSCETDVPECRKPLWRILHLRQRTAIGVVPTLTPPWKSRNLCPDEKGILCERLRGTSASNYFGSLSAMADASNFSCKVVGAAKRKEGRKEGRKIKEKEDVTTPTTIPSTDRPTGTAGNHLLPYLSTGRENRAFIGSIDRTPLH